MDIFRKAYRTLNPDEVQAMNDDDAQVPIPDHPNGDEETGGEEAGDAGE